MIALLLFSCLERVTGEEVPLDPRYYAAVEAVQGEAGIGGGSSVPFSDIDGPKVTVSGFVIESSGTAAQIETFRDSSQKVALSMPMDLCTMVNFLPLVVTGCLSDTDTENRCRRADHSTLADGRMTV